ncbi:RNase H domain-containing protein [Trichonephila clavipes]|nr:RNase H domain-containing protein [Trichonephila clavipes]
MKYGYYVIAEVLSNTLTTGQMLETKHRSQFLKILKNFPSNMRYTSNGFHLTLVSGNDTADLLAKEGVTEDLMSRRTLTFSEIFSKTKSLIQELWKTLPTHPWYNRQAPGGALSIKADRVVQTTISRLASGHIRGLSFNLGQKIYENCTKCNLVQATQIIFCFVQDLIGRTSIPVLFWCTIS